MHLARMPNEVGLYTSQGAEYVMGGTHHTYYSVLARSVS